MRHRASGRRTARFALAPHPSIASDRPLHALPGLLGGLLLAALLTGCGETPEEARFKLSELGYEYGPAALFVAINGKDQVAVDLLMRAGLDPDERLPYRGLMQLGHTDAETPEFLQMLQGSAQKPWVPEIQAWLGRIGDRTRNRYRATPLIVATVMGNTPAIQTLIRAGADPNLPDSATFTPLFWAVTQGRTDSVRTLLENGAELGTEEQGTVLLTSAVRSTLDNESTTMLELILGAGGKAIVRDTPIVPALTYAARGGDLGLIELLLDAGATADARDEKGNTALVQAVTGGRTEAVEMLLDADADPNLADDRGVTPLIAAGSSGEFTLFEALLDGGADPNARSKDGETALIGAALRGDMDKLDLLLEAGVDLDLQNREGDTALHAAVRRDWSTNEERAASRTGDSHLREPNFTVAALLDAGADPNVANAKGETPLFTAIDKAHVGNAGALLAGGADPIVQNEKGETPIVKAALAPKTSSSTDRYGRDFKDRTRDILGLLIEAARGSAGLDLKNEDGLTALMLAAREGMDDAVGALIDGGAGLDVRDAHGFTALIVMADKNRLEPARAMLDAGADPNIQTDAGYTALMYATGRANLELINALLAAGADPTLQDAEGRTALNNVPRFRREVYQAIQQAIARFESQRAAVEPEPVATAKASPPPVEIEYPEPVPDPKPEPDAGPDARLADETYLGGMKKRGMKLYALSSDGNWCGENLVFKIQAESAAVFTDGTADFYMKRFGERINDEAFCPAAQVAEIYGYEDGNGEPVFRGRSTADGGWAVN